MDLYSEIPTSISVIDNVGVDKSISDNLIKPANLALSKLESKMKRGNLIQGSKTTPLGDNVTVRCDIKYGLRYITITIGADEDVKIEENDCWCCGPCIVAGNIIEIADSEYKEDSHYYASVELCQNGSSIKPKSVIKRTSFSSCGSSSYTEEKLQSKTFVAKILQGVAFSCYNEHREGDRVLVLVSPLQEFVTTNYGDFSPCINKRIVANGPIEEYKVNMSLDFINSSGISCQITKDSQIWDPDEEIPGDINYFPFRILPINIESCL